jgi:hypothetical protein
MKGFGNENGMDGVVIVMPEMREKWIKLGQPGCIGTNLLAVEWGESVS